MLHFVEGDLFDCEADIRVNTVNCVGVMGKGIAVRFKRKYPDMYDEYRTLCLQGELRPGQLHIWTDTDGTTVVNFPTKDHWWDLSTYAYVEDGLVALRKFLLTKPKSRVALPALGCGNGGLDWEKVKYLIRTHLKKLPLAIFVFPPQASRSESIMSDIQRLQAVRDSAEKALDQFEENNPEYTCLKRDLEVANELLKRLPEKPMSEKTVHRYWFGPEDSVFICSTHPLPEWATTALKVHFSPRKKSGEQLEFPFMAQVDPAPVAFTTKIACPVCGVYTDGGVHENYRGEKCTSVYGRRGWTTAEYEG